MGVWGKTKGGPAFRAFAAESDEWPAPVSDAYVRPRKERGASAGDPFHGGNRIGRAGMDLKYLLTSSLTLDATVNPDFGQVEVDPAVVNLSAFETSFPERRPFFVASSGIFSYGGFNCFFCSNTSSLSAFYTRRIGRSPPGVHGHLGGKYAMAGRLRHPRCRQVTARPRDHGGFSTP